MQLMNLARSQENVGTPSLNIFVNVELAAYVIMPNHVHGIIVTRENKLLSSVGARHASPLPPRGVKPNS